MVGRPVRVKSPKNPRSLPPVVEKRIQQLKRLTTGWDSYSARPINKKAIDRAISLLAQISSDFGNQFVERVFIAPCSDGGIQLEWESKSRELILKIAPDGKELNFLLTSPFGGEREGAITSSAELNSLFQEISNPQGV